MRTIFLPTWMSLLVLVVSAVSAQAPQDEAAPAAESPTANVAKAPVVPSVGRFDRDKVFAAYWRRARHAEAVRQFNADLAALSGNEEPEEMTLRRIRIQREGNTLNTRFEADLRQAIGKLAGPNHVFVVLGSDPYWQASEVKSVDLTDSLAAELSIVPAADPAAIK